MNFVKDLGADGVLPRRTVLLNRSMYRTRSNSIMTSHDLYLNLNIVVYHNPDNHKFTIPVRGVYRTSQKPNIIGVKDSHRTDSGVHESAKDRAAARSASLSTSHNCTPTMRWAPLVAGQPKFGWVRGRYFTCWSKSAKG